jgi:multimeric flavodoxin WrbA
MAMKPPRAPLPSDAKLSGAKKKLLVVYHTQGVRTAELAEAVMQGARSIDETETQLKRAFDTTAEDLLAADGIVFGTPENFGYMSGALKDLFDRTYYACENRVDGKPYAVFICAGNDGTGAVFNIDRICTGLKLKKVFEPVVARKVNTPELLAKCEELGATLAAGIAFGVF